MFIKLWIIATSLTSLNSLLSHYIVLLWKKCTTSPSNDFCFHAQTIFPRFSDYYLGHPICGFNKLAPCARMLHNPSLFLITSQILNLYPLRLSIFYSCLCLDMAFFLKSDKKSEELYSPNYCAYRKTKTTNLNCS